MNTKTKTTASPNQLALSMTTPITAKKDPAADRTDRPTRDDRLAAAHAVLARGLAGVRTDPAALAAFLAFRSHFREYSLNNCLLIWLQRPAARHCMGLRTWAKHGRQVRKGERGLMVLAPVLRKPTAAEVATGADPDGSRAVAYRTATTFDYEQTRAVRPDALVYAPPAGRLDAAAPDGLVARLEAVARSVGYAVHYTELGYADGWCRPWDRTITVRAGLTGADRASVLTHELAHALAHGPDTRASGDRETTRAQKEVQAEAAAYVVLAALGLDTARASLPYIKSWATDDEALGRELAAVDRIAADLLARVEATAA